MMMDDRTILFISMDAFFASIEQRENPELRGKPVAVGSSDRRTGVIASPSIEAWRFGVKTALATKVAKKKCKNLLIVPPRMKIYKNESNKLFDILMRYTDLIERVSWSEAYMDITEDKLGKDSAIELGEELAKEIYEKMKLHCSIGISINKFMAKVASEYKRPQGFTAIYEKDVLHYVQNLEIEKFDIFLPATIRKLQRLNIRLGKDLLKMNRVDMSLNFGRTGDLIYDIARGIDRRPLDLEHKLK
jgi:DNA polymerase-4